MIASLGIIGDDGKGKLSKWFALSICLSILILCLAGQGEAAAASGADSSNAVNSPSSGSGANDGSFMSEDPRIVAMMADWYNVTKHPRYVCNAEVLIPYGEIP